MLATLIRHVGDFQLAEDAVQDAFADAVSAWRRDGVPARPGAWLTVAARRRAIDRMRRNRSVADRADRLAELMRLDRQEHPDEGEDSAIVDDRLRLIFTCCHPALDLPARVALTLRALGGLTTGEIARAFLVAEPTMGKRIVRAKRKIADEAEVWGLLALMLLHDARRDARVAPDGRYLALDQQDRSRWDRELLGTGLEALDRAMRFRRPGQYQLQAAITAVHVGGADTGTTDCEQIAELYRALGEIAPSPVVELNRAAAVGFAVGPQAGLELLEPLLADPALERYQPLHAAHADLLRRAGDAVAAARAYERAIALSTNAVERAELQRRLSTLDAY